MPLLRAVRTADGASPELVEETEKVLGTFPGVQLHIGTVLLGAGTLFCSSRHVYWLCDSGPLRDVRVDARSVMVHALDPGAEPFPAPNVYCQLDLGEGLLESEGDDDEDEGEGEE
eukprot:EG_transcript_59015